MRLQSLLSVLNKNTRVNVADVYTNKLLGKYYDTHAFAEVLNHLHIECIDVMNEDLLEVAVKFDHLKYFNSFPKVVATLFIEWLEKEEHIKLQKVESDYGMLYVDADNYAHSIDSFITNIVARHDNFVDYVLTHLDVIDEECLAY